MQGDGGLSERGWTIVLVCLLVASAITIAMPFINW